MSHHGVRSGVALCGATLVVRPRAPEPPMPAPSPLSWLESHESESLRRLIDWLKIPSISTDPAYKGDVQRAADWAAARLREVGFSVEVCPTGDPPGSGHPVVMATVPPAP